MGRMMLMAMMAVVASVVVAAPKTTRTRSAGPVADEMPARAREARVTIDQFPKPGRQSTMAAPSVDGGSIIGQCYAKPRRWIVLESKYSTYSRWQDRLTFTWHVLLDTASATEKDRTDRIAPYSYFTKSVTYANIPKGTHAASVCLHPSYLERFGEPRAVGLVITDAEGKVLAGDCESEIKGIPTHPKTMEAAFWNDAKIMNSRDANGEPMIERRQGLMDRSKTIWALVNPNDYEHVAE